MATSASVSVSTVPVDDAILAVKYQQKNELEHVLDRPDTHIGSVELVQSDMWIFENGENGDNNGHDRIVQKNITYIQGLFKLFDEAIINCRDHVMRMQSHIDAGKPNCLPVTSIAVDIDEATGLLTLTNDGAGIDVAMHPTLGIWIPELIFGHLRSSTNYDDKEKDDAVALRQKIAQEGPYYGLWGGKNGLGIKLVFIWSTFGSVETIDHVRGLKFYQEFHNNLSVIGEPKITKCSSKKPYTRVSFRPDYARLKLNQGDDGVFTGLDADLVALLKKRVYDVAAVTDKTIKVKLNGVLLPTKTFSQYVDLYIGSNKQEAPRVYEAAENGRWEYVVALSPNSEFMQVSFVNGIYMQKGGKHVDYIIDQITRKVRDYIEKKKKRVVKASAIKEQLVLFLRCDIMFPAFDSQTKDYLNTPVSKFGSSCSVSDAFVEKVAKSLGVMDIACAISEAKDKNNDKKTDGAKRSRVTGIPKLDDANWAGTAKSNQCVLILCEGDSAKAGVISGLSVQDRNIYGVFALKGKLENIREPAHDKIKPDGEIAAIKKTLGLSEAGVYKTADDVANQLRYGRVLIMTDQDLDGSHIKGLCINLFHHKWRSLTCIPGFISFMNTPILKARKGTQELVFYSQGEFNTWLETQTKGTNGWTIKYYKGLGTSVGKEFKEYFRTPKLVDFHHSGPECDNQIDLMFNKKRANDRKALLETYDQTNYLDTSHTSVTYTDFVQKELLGFSCADCVRSIPSVIDGLKPSMRKVLFSAFKRNLKAEVKVAQFVGYASEHSAYHHGEASLAGTIIGMAQAFVGSNNINLLAPEGQFGTRIQGGKDSASPRYIFTRLEEITRALFPEHDDPLLKYLEEDNMRIEPETYIPIIPTLLVNGSSGIGTGHSTDIPCYNPREIIAHLRAFIRDPNEFWSSINPTQIWTPFYHGFRGVISCGSSDGETNQFVCKGLYERRGGDTIYISELPVQKWTAKYREHLEKLEADKIIKSYVSLCTDTAISFTVTFPSKAELDKLIATQVGGSNGDFNKLEQLLQLRTTISTNNMVAYSPDQKLRKYTVADMFGDFIPVRAELYVKRKEHLLTVLRQQLIILSNKARFVRDETVDLRKKTATQVRADLEERGYDLVDDSYHYLTKMPIDSITEEHAARIVREYEDKRRELDEIEKTTPTQMWENDLNRLEEVYERFVRERDARGEDLDGTGDNIKGGTGKRKTIAKAAATATSRRKK